ncbi:unnamed protein product, partial [Timema podura]|nr:unnamed protein product [Timema podura]
PVTATKKPARVEASTQQAIVTVAVIFVVSLVALGYIYMKFPELEEHEKQHIKLPWDIEDAKQLGRVLDKYKERYFFEVLTAIVVTYILYPFIENIYGYKVRVFA